MRAKYLNKRRRNLVEFTFPVSIGEFIPAMGDFIIYDGLGFKVTMRTIDYEKGLISVRGYCNYEGTELENL
jgi:hypothetical protein